MQSITHPEHAESHATHLREGYFMGCLPAVVTSLKDPKKAGRIKARASLIDDFNDLPNATDGWIPVTTRYVLTDTPGGDIAPLQVGSQVILLPIMGRMDNWVCIGAIHTSAEPPHPSHDINAGLYGEYSPEGISYVRSGSAAEIKSYPHGVVKGVTSTGDTSTKTSSTLMTQSSDGKVHIENKAAAMNMSPTGTVGIVNSVGSSLNLNDKGSIGINSAHQSSIIFDKGKVEIAGPPKGGSKQIDAYRKTLSKGMGGLNEMFDSIKSIDLKNLNIESITATIGTVKDVLAKGQTVLGDIQSAKAQAEGLLNNITQNPAEAIELVAPQISDFLDKNLDKVIPQLKTAIENGVGGAEIFSQISALLPVDVFANLDSIQGQLNAFKTRPELATTAIVNEIYGTVVKDYEALLGPNLQYSIDRVIKIYKAKAPTWTSDPNGATKLLIEQQALPTTLVVDLAILANSSPSEITIQLERLHQSDPAYLDASIAAAWRKYRIGAIKAAVPVPLAAKLTEEAIDRILTAPDATAAIGQLAIAAQATALAGATSPSLILDAGLQGIPSANRTIEALDRDERDKSLAEMVSLVGNPAFLEVTALFDRAAGINLDKPLVRDSIGSFQSTFAAVRDRLNLRFTKEDALCRSAIQFILQDLDNFIKNRVRVFTAQAAKNPNWAIDIIALKFQVDALIEGTKKYQVSYPAINLFWDDIYSSLGEFLKSEAQIDEQVAARSIAAQLRSTIAPRANDRSALSIARSKLMPLDWVPRPEFNEKSLKELRVEIVQLGVAIAKLPDLSDGCDSSDTNVLDRAAVTINEILTKLDRQLSINNPLVFTEITGRIAKFESATIKYQLTSKIRNDVLDLFNSTIGDLTEAELDRARELHTQQLAKQTAARRRNGTPDRAPEIPYAVALMEYRQMGQLVLSTLTDTNETINYPNTVRRIIAEFNVVVRDWFVRNAVSNSAAELVDLPAIYDLKVVAQEFITNHTNDTAQFPKLNGVWDEILLTTDYLLFYPTSQGAASGNNTVQMPLSANLPGGYAKPTNLTQPVVGQNDWLKATIAIAKSIMTDITNIYPPFQQYQELAIKALDVLPTIFPSAKVTLTDNKLDLKASNSGSKMSLVEDAAKVTSGGGAAMSLGAGTAQMVSGVAGAALNLSAGLGKLTGGPLGGEVLATLGTAILSGPGGLSSIAAGLGGINFSTPWGGFGFGSSGFGLTGDQPVNFAVQEADYDGGAAALFIDSKKGAGIHTTDLYSGNVNAEIKVFDGQISIGIPNAPHTQIEINSLGVSIGGVNMNYYTYQFGYILGRLRVLESRASDQ